MTCIESARVRRGQAQVVGGNAAATGAEGHAMAIDVLSQVPVGNAPVHRTGLADLRFGSGYEAFGCSVNRVGVQDLFAKYEECGFLYPAKRERLKPFLPVILENWRRSMLSVGGKSLHDVVVYDDASSGAWASVTWWATTNRTIHSQHLVSMGVPEASRAVLLSSQSEIHSYNHLAIQNWFRAANRYPARVFGSCTVSLGSASSALHEHVCVMLDRNRVPPAPCGIRVHRGSDSDSPAIEHLARRLCGAVQAEADEWAAGDVELEKLDARYQEVGLRRYRRVFLATAPGRLDPVGMAVAYRGPLGLSFSFLENRCELWIDPHADTEQHAEAIAALVNGVSSVYADCELPFILLATDARGAEALVSQGAQPMQDYSRSIWLRPAFGGWYDHVNGFYSRIIGAARRRRESAGPGVDP